jgi:Uma2 family endonuclease
MTHLKESKPYPEPEDIESDKVCEPAIAYGNPSIRYSYADYLTWLDDKRREILNGIVHLMTAVYTRHAQLSYRLILKLGSYIEKKNASCLVFPAPFDVRLPKGEDKADDRIYTVVQPDIVVVCDHSKIDERGCLGAPDITIEILSKSTAQYDLNKKFYVYQDAGVREYWVVYPKEKQVTIFSLQEEGVFDEGTNFQEGDKLTSNVLKGLVIDTDELFKNLF